MNSPIPFALLALASTALGGGAPQSTSEASSAHRSHGAGPLPALAVQDPRDDAQDSDDADDSSDEVGAENADADEAQTADEGDETEMSDVPDVADAPDAPDAPDAAEAPEMPDVDGGQPIEIGQLGDGELAEIAMDESLNGGDDEIESLDEQGREALGSDSEGEQNAAAQDLRSALEEQRRAIEESARELQRVQREQRETVARAMEESRRAMRESMKAQQDASAHWRQSVEQLKQMRGRMPNADQSPSIATPWQSGAADPQSIQALQERVAELERRLRDSHGGSASAGASATGSAPGGGAGQVCAPAAGAAAEAGHGESASVMTFGNVDGSKVFAAPKASGGWKVFTAPGGKGFTLQTGERRELGTMRLDPSSIAKYKVEALKAKKLGDEARAQALKSLSAAGISLGAMPHITQGGKVFVAPSVPPTSGLFSAGGFEKVPDAPVAKAAGGMGGGPSGAAPRAAALSEDALRELTSLIREMREEVHGLRQELHSLRDDLHASHGELR